MSYKAVVSRIHTRPHPNADRLQLGTAASCQVVTSLDVQDGELGIFFPPDGQLSHDFCVANNLYNASARAELSLPEVEKPGYFDKNRRVRAQAFRGVKSEGIWMPLSSLAYIEPAVDKLLHDGDQVDVLCGVQFCEKYYTPATRRAMRSGQVKVRKDNPMFPKHADTMQFRFLADLPEDSVVYITEKLHGTSGRYGLVLDEQPRTFWQRLFRRPATKAWVYLNGSRNVTLEKTSGPGFYGTNDFRYNAVANLELRKGEVLFFEIVGYVSDETPIMPAQDTAKLPELAKTYGKKMAYTYGCEAGEIDVFVYKILQLNEDGHGYELSWNQLRQRCDQLGLKVVPLLMSPLTMQSKDTLQAEVERLAEGSSMVDPRHIREGVVVRIESPLGTQHVKEKSFAFKVLEGIVKDKADYVDLEEVS